MCLTELVIIIAILILLLWIFPKIAADTKEHFDVYHNHRRGAQHVYATTGVPFTGKIEKLTPEQAGRLAKYTWSEADPQGLDVYDHYYENFVHKNKYANQRPDTAADDIPYREVDTDGNEGNRGGGVYDVKFHVYSGIPGVDGYSNYSITGMADPDPLYMDFNGQTIVLNQKNF